MSATKQIINAGVHIPACLRGKVRFHCASEIRFALCASLAWALLYNFSFWEQAAQAMWQPSWHAALFLTALFVLVLLLQTILVLLIPTRALMRIAVAVLFVVAAASAHFSANYGALMNEDMMRNVFETDLAEAGSLVTAEFLMQIFFLGLLPAWLISRVTLPPMRWWPSLLRRVGYISIALLLCVADLFACSADYAVFFREHKPIRFALSPGAPAVSTVALLNDARGRHAGPVRLAGGPVERMMQQNTARPLVLFLVVGETARAANFQLGGYARPTNPELNGQDGLVYFDHVTACGTSTAVSVPCMFSNLGRAAFKVDEAGGYTNLVDALAAAGFDVEWRDNNAGCKGVCERVRQVSYAAHSDAELCPNAYCYDEVMLQGLSARLRKLTRDTVIVFHQIGSHGPAYHERYPPEFERFQPACQSNELQRCTAQEVVNAYDNTIAYTDHVLARLIATLRASADRVDGLLLYASDHGESLGEQGIYLHGLPYRFAPDFQTGVPMLFWASEAYALRTGLDLNCARSMAGEPLSHDNLYHTILGATGTRNDAYDARQDFLSTCRIPQVHRYALRH